MEGSFESTLKRVLEKLATPQRHVKDDTCLQKLLDVLENKFSDREQIEDSGILQFLKSIETQQQIGPEIVTFGIQVFSVIVQKKELSCHFSSHFRSFIQHVMKERDIGHPSVGTALYMSLEQMLQNRELIDICSAEELLRKSWSILESGKSIFLSNAVSKFITSLTIANGCNEEFHTNKSEFVKGILNTLLTYLELFSGKNQLHKKNEHLKTRSFVCHCLRVLNGIMGNLDQSCTILHDLKQNIIKVIQQENGELFDLALEILLGYYKHNKESQKSSKIELQKLLTDLSKESFFKAQKICLALLINRYFMELDEMLMNTILCPLHVVNQTNTVNHKLYDTNPDKCLQQMSKKTDCTVLLCHTVDCLSTLYTDNKSLILVQNISLDRSEVCRQIFKLLEHTTESCVTMTINHNNILGNRKVQQKCLDFITNDISQFVDIQSDLVAVLICIIKQTDLDSVTYTKCLDCMLTIIPVVCDNNSCHGNSLQNLDVEFSQIMQRHLCDMKWEIRDTMVEFIHKIMKNYQGNSVVTNWLVEKRLPSLIWQSVSDSESYVRASAVSCLQSILQSEILRRDLLNHLSISLDDLEEKVLDILISDSEAFVRRSVASFIVAIFPDKTLVSSKIEHLIYNVMMKAVDDFDWEVKLKTLEFWELMIEKELKISDVRKNCALEDIPSYASGLYPGTSSSGIKPQSEDELRTVISGIETLQDIGCWEALYKLMEDYDQSVSEQTCKLLVRVRDYIKNKFDLKKSFESRTDAHFEQESKILDTPSLENDEVHNHSLKRKSDSQNGCNEQESKIARMEKHENQGSHQEIGLPDIVVRLVNETKLDFILSSCRSDGPSEEYNNNPLSLLEDILADLESQDHGEDEDNAVDCY